ncbi:MAG TPA: PilX N-terminal domain-containing pilus assembly protein [Woeseiaceae bacterium]|nr:PilX N-terminal domain-containing pilus assembly protein [Woeseiaceae bacterium]
MRHRQLPDGRESGAALIVALIFLLLMTLISTSSMRTSTMQERMAGNLRDWNIGFQSAEATLRAAEDFLLNEVNLPAFNDANGFYQLNSPARPDWTTNVFATGNGVRNVTVEEGLPTTHYYVEQLSSIRPAGTSTETGTPVEEIYYFRVTAVGYGAAVDNGGSPLTAVVLQSVYRSR